MFGTDLCKTVFRLGKYLCAAMIKKKVNKNNVDVAEMSLEAVPSQQYSTCVGSLLFGLAAFARYLTFRTNNITIFVISETIVLRTRDAQAILYVWFLSIL